MIGFEKSRKSGVSGNSSLLLTSNLLNVEEKERLDKIRESWNFYEGYHWESLPVLDTPELTINYCRAFVDKFVSFELGKSFSIQTNPALDKVVVTKDGRTLFQFLEDVWEDNNQFSFCTDMGQMKAITGEAWVQTRFFDKDELEDPLNEYPDGRIGILLYSTETVFPKFDPHRKGVLISLSIIYDYVDYEINILTDKSTEVKRIFKQIWTKDKVSTDYGKGEEPEIAENTYGFIPFVQIKNLSVAGRNEGRGDLDDIIPLNTELNMKSSNISEIIDYHAAPVTIVYGAKIGNIEKGANKVWGGLPKDARVENLNMGNDLNTSSTHIGFLKNSMCEIGGIPESALGGAQSISNTSGVALQYLNLPLVEKTRIKKMNTETALELLCKYIISIALKEGVINKPEKVIVIESGTELEKPLTNRDFYWVEVNLPDTLPKDMLIELQQIQAEMSLGMESRRGGMRRLGKENIDKLINDIDTERAENPDLYGVTEDPMLNSGMLNSQTPVEQVRTEINSANAPV